MSPFIKHDADKLMLHLVDPRFIEGLAAVLTLGATKYSPDNWKACPDPYERYYSALQRHLLAYAKDEPTDSESGLSHLYHAACCLMFLAHFERDAEEPELTTEDVADMPSDVWRVPL